MCGMEDQRVGAAFRAVRVRGGRRQADIAAAVGVPRSTVSRIERRELDRYPLRVARAVATALDIRPDVLPRWRGADLDRLLNHAHADLHESVARAFAGLPDWTVAPEVSFSFDGERGVIDILAWHPLARSLLIVELKTALVDPQELVSTTDRRVRLASETCHGRGWRPLTVSAWTILAETYQSSSRRSLCSLAAQRLPG
jgi:transcriptional regulator with XRE-family HTH domain